MRFAAAQKQTLDYLSSAEFKEREDAQTTVSSLPILKKIVEKGFVTDNSQEGIINSG